MKKLLYLLLSLQMSVVFAYSSDYKIDKNTSVKEIRALLKQVLELKRTGVSKDQKTGVQIVDVARNGNVEKVRKSYLNDYYNNAHKTIIHTWEPEEKY